LLKTERWAVPYGSLPRLNFFLSFLKSTCVFKN